MEFVSKFEEACEKLGRSTAIPDVSMFPERLQGHLTALFKLDTILEVNNNGWKADIADIDQWKYYPYFRVNKDSSKKSGFGLSFYVCVCDDSVSYLGARLACKSEELARFMGKNCTELYEELHA